MELKIPMVLNVEYGGCHLTEEVIRRLTARGCKWVSECQKSEGSRPRWFLPYRGGDDSLRADEDLVAVVRELTKEYEAKTEHLESWQARAELRRDLLADLAVVEVRVLVEVHDQDGKEFVRVAGGTW